MQMPLETSYSLSQIRDCALLSHDDTGSVDSLETETSGISGDRDDERFVTIPVVIPKFGVQEPHNTVQVSVSLDSPPTYWGLLDEIVSASESILWGFAEGDDGEFATAKREMEKYMHGRVFFHMAHQQYLVLAQKSSLTQHEATGNISEELEQPQQEKQKWKRSDGKPPRTVPKELSEERGKSTTPLRHQPLAEQTSQTASSQGDAGKTGRREPHNGAAHNKPAAPPCAVPSFAMTSTLDFVCECSGQTFPDMNLYKNTIPWFVCTELQDTCTAENAGNLAGQKNCTATYGDNCGTEDVQDHQGEGAATTTASSSTSAGSQSTPTSSSAPTSSTSEGAAPTAHIKHIGNGAAAVALGLLAYAL
ncbi:hypothetical protein GQX73_g10302 [Xylaria multiplex]|uniref:DUF7707 domain-containing protein n=1 Tax=Xylaria multiplex TaxID=323545 RepID=A0A7C8IT59_9PEZI|nr:hypothetical protein GQX73_g10302 [Xylaria multiplex]